MALCSLGWRPDVQDLRDFVLENEHWMDHPATVDLREHELEASVQSSDPLLHMSCATSLLRMLNWQSKKWRGKRLDGSAEFLHKLTLKICGGGGLTGVGHRSVLKTLKRFGAPPESLCQDDSETPLPERPELFGYSRQYGNIKYLRLDSWEKTPRESLQSMKYWLAYGNPFILGFSVPHSVSPAAVSIPFETLRGGSMGGTSCVVMGYDDQFSALYPLEQNQYKFSQHPNGAFLIQTSWGKHWGDQGYSWLPYEFIENRFACDAWAVECSFDQNIPLV